MITCSKSTDKLIILCNTLEKLPKEILEKVSEFKLFWIKLPINENEYMLVPNVEVKFKS